MRAARPVSLTQSTRNSYKASLVIRAAWIIEPLLAREEAQMIIFWYRVTGTAFYHSTRTARPRLRSHTEMFKARA